MKFLNRLNTGSKIFNIMNFISGPIISALIGLATIPILTRLLTIEDFGRVNMFIISQNFIYMLVYISMDQAFVRFFYEHKDNKSKYMTNMITLPALITFLLIIITLFFRDDLSFLIFNEASTFTLICMILTVPFGIVERFSQLTVRMLNKGMLYSILSLIQKLIIFVCSIVFLFSFDVNYKIIIVVYLIAQICSSLVAMIYTLEYWKSIRYKSVDFQYLKVYLSYSIPMYPSSLMVWGLNSISFFLLRYLSDYREIGYYSGATRITNILSTLQVAVMSFWVPMAYKWENEKKELSYFENAIKILTLSSSFVFIGILLFKDILIQLLSEDYYKAIMILPFLLFVPIMNLNSEIIGIGINIAKKTYWNTIISLMTFILTVVLGINFIKLYGAMGAALANGLSYIVYYIFKWGVSSRLWYRVDWKFYLLNLLSLLSCSFVTYFFNSIFSTLYNIIIIVLISISLVKKLLPLLVSAKLKK